MNANQYIVINDAYIPSIGIWVRKGQSIIIKKIFANAITQNDKHLKLEKEIELDSRRSYVIIEKNEKLESIQHAEFNENIPNKSMANKRKKVRTK